MAPLPGLPRAQRPLPHVRDDRLVNETRDARFFDRLDVAMAAIAMPDGLHAPPGPGGGRTRTSTRHRPVQDIEDQYKTSFRVPGGQHEIRDGAFGLRGVSSVLMRFMHSILGRRAVSFNSTGRARPAVGPPGSGAPMLGRFVHPNLLYDARGAPGARAYGA